MAARDTSLGEPASVREVNAPELPEIHRLDRRTLANAPPCSDIGVRGLVAGDDPFASYTLLSMDSNTGWHRRGDTIGAYRVLGVGSERVWLVQPSTPSTYRLCQAEVGRVAATPRPAADSPSEHSSVAGTASQPLAHLSKKIEARGPLDFILDRSVIDELIAQQALVVDLVRTRLVAGGEPGGGGVELARITPSSVIEKLGLISGDRLQRAAGVDLDSMEHGLIALSRLRTSDRFTLEVLRGGRRTTLSYEVR